jgi:glutathione synthase/RimK-type ligase-like ATP-grasp enzyme
MRIHFMLVRRVPPVPSPVLVEVFDILRDRGHEVDSGIAEEMVRRADLLEPEHDLYVLKSHTQLSLSVAGLLHARGAQILGPYEACATTQNKIITARVLRAAGVPVPATWVIGDPAELEPIVANHPLIVKPYQGHRGAGVHVVRDAAELAAAAAANGGGPIVVQEHIAGPGEDLKVYVAGDEVFAVRKPFSSTSFSVPGRPVDVTSDVRNVALRCGEALGLGLYGLDVIESGDGPVVVDVNYFPGYKGVPGVAPLIADYIEDYACRAVREIAA